MNLEKLLIETDPKHSDYVDSVAYLIASQEAKVRDGYVLLHVRKRPWWLPAPCYRWFLSRILVLNNFRNV